MTDLTQALASANVRAFLRVIRAGESSQTDDAYSMRYGGVQFHGWADHPRIYVDTPWGKTSAAGAYQFLAATWDECRKALNLPDFSPESQDLAAVFLIRRRGALDDVVAGRITDAIAKCGKEWASLPGSPYGQPTRTLQLAMATYRQYGGTLAGAPAPIPPSIPAHSPPIAAPPEQPEKPMIPALILALGKSLIGALTPLAAEKIQREIGRHTDKPEVAEQVTAAIVEAAQTATGLADPIEAVAAAKQAPEVLAKVETSALEMLDRMAPVLDRLAAIDKADHQATEASRDAAAGRAAGEPWDMTPLLIIGALGMIGLLIVFVGGIAVYQVIKGQIAPEVWAQIAGLIGFVSGVGTTIYAYRFGSSRSSLAKDAVIGELSRRG